ncbi:hypothetical protein GCM10009554_56870 [Kribbella koreensis]|uniref:Uncharacterized protein n=2 Tax=Kribbella TaxID=182639 RepID=A0ABP6WNR7_9ACTN
MLSPDPNTITSNRAKAGVTSADPAAGDRSGDFASGAGGCRSAVAGSSQVVMDSP